MTRPTVVVGAGIAGLAAAHELRRRKRDAPVVVLEAQDRAGGVIWSERVDGFLCEWAASGFLESGDEPGAPALARSLGLDVVPAAPEAKKRWVWRHGALHALPTSPPALIKSKLMTGRGKLRILREPFVRRGKGEETVAAFGRRRLGAEATDALLVPFVTGIYAGDAEQLSMAAALPKLASLEAKHGSLFRGLVASRGAGRPRLLAPRDGAGALPKELARRLGDVVRTGVKVDRLERAGGGWTVVAGGERLDAARVVLATASTPAAALVAEHDALLAGRLREIPYVGAAVVYVGLARADVPHPLDGFGFLVAEREDLRCLGCVFDSVVWPGRAPDGQVLFRLIYGGARDPGAVTLDDAALGRAVAGDLRAALGVTAAPRFFGVRRHPRAIAQYHVGHLARVAEADRRAAALGLVLAGSAYHGVAVNDCVKDATRVADLVEGAT